MERDFKLVMDLPLISIIVPIYKVQPFLRKCIESLVQQTYQNLEIILVDDGSPDHCPEICDEFAESDPRIIVIHKKNEGVPAARNTGLKAASGQYICFVDGDDYIDADYYEELYSHIGDSEIIICGYKRVDQNGENVFHGTFEEGCIEIGTDNPYLDAFFKYSAFGFPWNKLYKASVVESVEFEDLMPREDFIFNLRVLSSARKITLHGSYAGYNWVRNPNSITQSVKPVYIERCIRIGKRLKDVLEQNGFVRRKDIYDGIMKILLTDIILTGVIKKKEYRTKQKLYYLQMLIRSGVGDGLIYRKEDCEYYKLLWLCLKIRSVLILYYSSVIMVKMNKQ